MRDTSEKHNGDIEQPTIAAIPYQTNPNIMVPAAPQGYYYYHTPQRAMYIDAPPPAEPKVGGKCCGCCCDYRRATFVVDILVCVFNVLAVLILVSYGGIYYDDNFGDNDVPYNILAIEAVLCTITVIAGGIGIYGSLQYNVYAVGFTGVWLLLNWMASLIDSIAFCAAFEDEPDDYRTYECRVSPEGVTLSFFIVVGFIYPHVLFIKEVIQGILTKDNYSREKYSCCCT